MCKSNMVMLLYIVILNRRRNANIERTCYAEVGMVVMHVKVNDVTHSTCTNISSMHFNYRSMTK